MKLLRVYFIHHKLREKTYAQYRLYRDFPKETNPEDAYGQIASTYGTLKGWQGPEDPILGDSKAPSNYAVIHSHTLVDPEREVATMSEWQSEQLELWGESQPTM